MSKAKQGGASGKNECIKVAIRCRPMSKNEIKDGREQVVRMVAEKGEVIIQKSSDEVPKIFTFDKCYDQYASQENIFMEIAYPIIENVLEGYNGTIFAYGQTGTGKTHTISGLPKDPVHKGIMSRSFETVFKSIECDSKCQYLVRASYLEIYNEEIRDLLSKNGQNKLDLKEKEGTVYVKDLSTFVVKSPEDMMDVFNEGTVNRHVRATNMNDTSSRSHSIFTITIESSSVGPDGKPHIKVGKLNIVDLAGSERLDKTGAQGEGAKEGIKINLSLSTLCHVISSLTDPKCTFVPYRDSKLTRLLQDSLGGNTKTCMIANVGPADYNMDETLSTLRYASRAKNIQNKPRINEDPKDTMIREFQEEIERLKSELNQFSGGKLNFDGGQVGPDGQTIIEVEKYVHVENKERMKQMEDQLEQEKLNIKKKFEKERRKIQQQVDVAEEERGKFLEELKQREDVANKEKSKQQKLLKRIKNMEEKLLHGNEAMEKAMKQEQDLLKSKQELEEKRILQIRLEQELQSKEDEKIDLEKKYTNQQEELEGKKKEIDKIWKKVQMKKNEIGDLQDEIHREREDLMDRIRELTREIRQKHLIIDQFIPAQEYMRIERRAEWAEDINDWIIPNVEYTGNNIKIQKAKKKEGKDAFANLNENILNLDESEDEDYEAAATKRVNEAISSILNEEEEETGAQLAFVPPEKQSVYFKYTDDGAVREDPEQAAKKEKNKKKRLQSAKRPLTAKKKKADMVTGDLVNMVQTMTSSQAAGKSIRQSKKMVYPKAQGLINQ